MLYTDVDHDCNADRVRDHCKNETLMDCCQKTKKPVGVPSCEEECCITDVSLVKIDSEYSFVESSFQFEKNNFLEKRLPNFFSNSKNVSFKSNKSPPNHHLSSSHKRALIQVYLI